MQVDLDPGEPFIIPGMPRCGTTFLYHNLRKHPAVFLAFMKESDYFSVNHGKGREWFEGLFAERGPDQAFGDISPYYFLDERSVARIHEHAPNARIIVGVRRPSEVALSLYTQMSVTQEVPPFEEFLHGFRFPVGDEYLEVALEERVLSRALRAFRERFGANLLLYSFEGFRADRLSVLRAIESFLGLPKFFEAGNFEDSVINAGSRRTIRAVELLIRSRAFIWIVRNLVPRRLLDWLRDRYERFRRPRAGAQGGGITDRDRELARRVFAADDREYEELFAGSQLVLGTGEVFAG